MQPHLSSSPAPRRSGNGGPGWPGAVVVIVTVMITNGWASADVKTVLLALLGFIAVRGDR